MAFHKILLVMPSGRHGLGYAVDLIPTGLEYLAASIRNHVSDIHIVDLKMEKKPVDFFLKRFKPDLVGISLCATEHIEGLDIAGKAKRRGAATVVGNFHPTGLPHLFASHPDVDFVVRGEGEETFLDLVKNGKAGDTPGLSYRSGDRVVHNPDREPIADLDDLPFPARSLRRHPYRDRILGGRRIDCLTFSRGCRGTCTFCCEPSVSRGIQRFRSAGNILEEILEIHRFHGRIPLTLNLTDPCALGHPAIMNTVCAGLTSMGLDLSLSCHVRADRVVSHPETIEKMVEAGFHSFEMGIESPNSEDLHSTQKGMTVDIHEKACRVIRRFGAHPLGTFVIGLPGQTEADILACPGYGRRIGLSKAAFGIATPFPGTEFFRELDARGLIFERDWTRFDEMHSVFHHRHLPDKRVEILASRCMSKFWTFGKILDMENLDRIRTGRRTPLLRFGKNLMALMTMGRDALVELQNDAAFRHILEFLEEAAVNGANEESGNLRMHDVVDMDALLRRIGNQLIAVTMMHRNRPLTSWVIGIRDRAVENIRTVQGEIRDATLHFRFDLGDIENNPRPNRVRTAYLLLKLLNSNRGLRRRFNLARIALAALFN